MERFFTGLKVFFSIYAPRQGGQSPAAPACSSTVLFWAVLALTTLWRVWIALSLGLCHDEAFYHIWALFPRWSYFDHPPLTGWLLAVSTRVLGHTVFAVRCWPLLGQTVTALAGWWCASGMFGREAGNRAGLLLCLVPFLAGNGILMTPDALLLPFGALSICGAWRAVCAQPGRASAWWAAVGVFAGLGMLSKYTMVLFFPACAAALVLSGTWRRAAAGFSGACLLAGAMFLPVVWWNSGHGWVSFIFQLNHGFSARGHSGAVPYYLAMLLVLFTPVLALLCFDAAVRVFRSRGRGELFLAAFFWTVVLFFLFSSFSKRIEANWPMIAIFPGLLLAAGRWPRVAPWLRRTAAAVTGVSTAVVMGYCLLPQDVPLAWHGRSFDVPRMAECAIGPSLAVTLRKLLDEHPADFVCVTSHQYLGQVAFQMPQLRDRLWMDACFAWPRTPWLDIPGRTGQTALIVSPDPIDDQVRVQFREIIPLEHAQYPYKKYLRNESYFYLGRGYKGLIRDRWPGEGMADDARA